MSDSLEAKWKRLAVEAKAEAAKLQDGPEQEALLERARQLEGACLMNRWLSSKEPLAAPLHF
jgi:hypothetical protein